MLACSNTLHAAFGDIAREFMVVAQVSEAASDFFKRVTASAKSCSSATAYGDER